MNIEEYSFLESERRFLERLLESLPPSATLTRLSLQARLKHVTDELAETSAQVAGQSSDPKIDKTCELQSRVSRKDF